METNALCHGSFHVQVNYDTNVPDEVVGEVIFTPSSEMQFGGFFCNAENVVGKGKEQWELSKIPLLATPSPQGCGAHNITHHTFQV